MTDLSNLPWTTPESNMSKSPSAPSSTMPAPSIKKLLHALSEIGSQQASATESTNACINQLPH